MSEQDFRDALRRTMDSVAPPPPMSDAPVLETAHRDRRRRRTMWAATGTAAVVAAIAVGVVVLAPSSPGGDGVQVGNQPPQPTGTQDVASSAGDSPAGSNTEETLPPGMTDRTQRSGPHHERGVTLATALDDVVTNAGFGAPGDLDGAEVKTNQANYDGKVDGVEKWSYMATTPVTKGSGVGKMIAEVSTVHEQVSGCALPRMWGLEGTCRELTVDGKKVAFVDAEEPGEDRIDQFAAYRHDDGTIVYVAQSAGYGFTQLPPLAGLPFTPEQLAGIAVDPRFAVIE